MPFRPLLPLLCLTLAAAPAPATAAPETLEAALGRRVAGQPVSCLPLRNIGSSQMIDGTAIIYKQSRRVWYVNRPAGGACSGLRDGRAIVTVVPSTQLCRGDIVTIVDPLTGMNFGGCGLGDFTPYRLPQ